MEVHKVSVRRCGWRVGLRMRPFFGRQRGQMRLNSNLHVADESWHRKCLLLQFFIPLSNGFRHCYLLLIKSIVSTDSSNECHLMFVMEM